MSAALFLLAAVLYVPPLQKLFDFSPASPLSVALSVLAGLSSIVWFEALKPIDGDLS
ncbi:MAG: cation transporting ATPase C-terminal domain-containing protein [Blastocatellia bacterium]